MGPPFVLRRYGFEEVPQLWHRVPQLRCHHPGAGARFPGAGSSVEIDEFEAVAGEDVNAGFGDDGEGVGLAERGDQMGG